MAGKFIIMNLFIRYFNQETVATNIDEAAAFLETLNDVKLADDALSRVNTYFTSNNQYPFRLKVNYTNYVLFLKTEASSIEEFKRMEQIRNEQKETGTFAPEKKKSALEIMSESKPGWYEASITFKRVVPIHDTNKFQYCDTRFSVRAKADSPMDCYNRIVNHLRNRQDVDSRSQFPSAKSANYTYKYLGEQRPDAQSEQQ